MAEDKLYYLGGPMTGYAEFNVPAFKEAKTVLEGLGMKIQLPVDIEEQKEGWEWGDYLAEDIRLICNKCSGMVLLPEWDRSRGAKLEIAAGLMQSLKYPDFEFYLYMPEEKKPVQILAKSMALAWRQNWSTYSKEARVA